MSQQDAIEAGDQRASVAGRVAAGAGLALGVTLVTGGTAHAADYTVTNLNAAGPGSLRDALNQADADRAVDRVVFQSGLSGTIDLNPKTGPYAYSGQLSVIYPVDIVGPGADQITVSGDGRSRVFNISSEYTGDNFSISGLKVTEGQAKYSDGGDIRSDDANLTLSDMVIRTGTAERGGGVWENYGTLTMRDSTVSGNGSTELGGGVWIGSNPSEYEQVTATTGQTDQQPVTPSVITGSTISKNGVGSKYNFRDAAQGSTDATTPSPRYGGGGGVYNESSVTLENSTIEGNMAQAQGGGIYTDAYSNYNAAPGADQLRVVSTTISGNTAGSGGGIYWTGYQANANPALPHPVLENSIVANNRADQVPNGDDLAGESTVGDPPPPAPPPSKDATPGDVTFDAAFSLIRDPSGVTVNETVPGSNITGQDPLLGALTGNGGPTETMALLPGSPAIDHGRTPAGETTDQRGQKRPFDLVDIGNSAAPGADGADMGAFEVQGSVPTGSCQGQPATLSGTENRDILNGTPGPDVIVGLGGNDTIKGFQGNDLICAGDGLDQVTGGTGDDRMLGEGGNDRIWGQGGNDTLIDNQGDDLLSGGVGNDVEKGGSGQDRVFGADGNDRLFGQGADDVILGAKGNDFLRGGPGNDRLSGGVGVNDVQQ